MRELLEKFLGRCRRAHEDEGGSAMVFAAMTMFTLVLFAFLTFQIGMASSDRMELQNSADAAAYSGALIEAESLESIAFLNDGMSFVYYALCRYAVDAIVYSTLNAFWMHDEYVFESGKIPSPAGDGAIFNLEQYRGILLNNPGARTNQDYLPGCPGPGQPQPPAPQKMNYDFVVLGKDGASLFESRYKAAKKHAAQLLPRGKQWLLDMASAERIIMRATPDMVRRHVIRVAKANGAEMVAVSNDLKDTWKTGTGAGASSDGAGFIDGSEGGDRDQRIDAAMAGRYESKDNPVDKETREIPDWFNVRKGDSSRTEGSGTYEQTRVCWNKRDWDHAADSDGQHRTHAAPYNRPQGAPNGHWHAVHSHNVLAISRFDGSQTPVGPVFGIVSLSGPPYLATHDLGHGITSGPDAQAHDVKTHPEGIPFEYQPYQIYYEFIGDPATDASSNESHHMAQACPTCNGGKNGPVTPYTQVRHNKDDGEMFLLREVGFDADSKPNEVHFRMGELPRPLRLKGRVFRAGVNVATWRSQPGRGAIFGGSPWGQVAIASAQIGVRGSDGVIGVATEVSDDSVTITKPNGTTRKIQLKSGERDSPDKLPNLYLGDENPQNAGMRFGARLVPIGRNLSWAGSAGGAGDDKAAANGVSGLLFNNDWYTDPNGTEQGPPPGVSDQMRPFLEKLVSDGNYTH